MKDLVISSQVLEELKLNPSGLLVDIAVHLYDQEKLSMSPAKKLARLTQIEFQQEMSKRGVYIKYDTEDFKKDMDTLQRMD